MTQLFGSGAVMGFVLGALGLYVGRPGAPFWEPSGPLVSPGAVLGVRRSAEARVPWKWNDLDFVLFRSGSLSSHWE